MLTSQQFEKFLTKSKVVCLLVNPDLTLRFYSEKASELLGLNSMHLNQNLWLKCFGTEDQEKVKSTLRTQSDLPISTTHTTSSNKLKSVLWLIERESGPEGLFFLTGKDVTEIQQKGLALDQAQNELDLQKFALDQSAIVAITDVSGKITYVNDKFCAISKYSREDLIGKTHRVINSSHHPKIFFEKMWRTISQGKVWEGEIKNRAMDNSFYWVWTTIVPFLDTMGRPTRYVSIRFDITAMKHAFELVDQERLKVIHAEKMASVGEMASGIAHELGNPLSTVQGRIELLLFSAERADIPKEQLKENLRTILRMTEKMGRIIKGMRNFARDGSRDSFHPASISSVIRDVIELSMDKIRSLGIEIKSGPIDESIYIECRESQILQVLANLLNNARDAVESSDTKWIQVSAQEQGEKVEIRVDDSGPGVPQEIRNTIFTPFFSTKELGKGTGLGLSISKTIIESHGGTLTLESNGEKSHHTSFVIRLPKKQSH